MVTRRPFDSSKICTLVKNYHKTTAFVILMKRSKEQTSITILLNMQNEKPREHHSLDKKKGVERVAKTVLNAKELVEIMMEGV